MRIISCLLTLTAALMPTACVRANPRVPSAVTPVAAAIVGPREARFVVPIAEPVTEWHWNMYMTSSMAREYRWEVELPDSVSAGHPYQFGFSLYKAPGDRVEPSRGSLAALLAKGQATVWERTADGGGIKAPWGHVAARPASGDSAIVLTIGDSTTLARLFGTRPATVTLVSMAPGQPERRTSIAVSYAGAPR